VPTLEKLVKLEYIFFFLADIKRMMGLKILPIRPIFKVSG